LYPAHSARLTLARLTRLKPSLPTRLHKARPHNPSWSVATQRRLPRPPRHPYTGPTMEAVLWSILDALRLPQFGLTTVFVVAYLSATLLPLGSVPVVLGVIKLNPELYWPVMLVATAGNTLGAITNWLVGYGAHSAVDKARGSATHVKALEWLRRFGPKACLVSWLPGIGDPLCAVAGWLRLPFWPCVFYMGLGMFLRYLTFISALLWLLPDEWAEFLG